MRAPTCLFVGILLLVPERLQAGPCFGDPEVTYCPAVPADQFVPTGGRVVFSDEPTLSTNPQQTRYFFVELHWNSDSNLAAFQGDNWSTMEADGLLPEAGPYISRLLDLESLQESQILARQYLPCAYVDTPIYDAGSGTVKPTVGAACASLLSSGSYYYAFARGIAGESSSTFGLRIQRGRWAGPWYSGLLPIGLIPLLACHLSTLIDRTALAPYCIFSCCDSADLASNNKMVVGAEEGLAPGCREWEFAGTLLPSRPCTELCDNHEDDDGDLLVDCDDPDCHSTSACDTCRSTPCADNGDQCDGPEHCEDGRCVSGPPLVCRLGSGCDPKLGCLECVPGTSESCFTGPVAARHVLPCQDGLRACTAGKWGSCAGEVVPAKENCLDGLDQDCDGLIDCADDDCSTMAWCQTGPDVRDGAIVITGWPGDSGIRDTRSDVPGIGPQCSPRPEVCNNIDDNCDGVIDEGFDVSTRCVVGIGACQRDGHRYCKPDGLGTACNAVAGDPVTEVCGNGLDDDCDGEVDEGCSPDGGIPSAAADTGTAGQGGTGGLGGPGGASGNGGAAGTGGIAGAPDASADHPVDSLSAFVDSGVDLPHDLPSDVPFVAAPDASHDANDSSTDLPVPANLLCNGGFDDGLLCWRTWIAPGMTGTGSVTSLAAETGGLGLRLVTSARPTGNYANDSEAFQPFIAVSAGKTYRFECRYRTADMGRIALGLREACGSGTYAGGGLPTACPIGATNCSNGGCWENYGACVDGLVSGGECYMGTVFLDLDTSNTWQTVGWTFGPLAISNGDRSRQDAKALILFSNRLGTIDIDNCSLTETQ